MSSDRLFTGDEMINMFWIGLAAGTLGNAAFVISAIMMGVTICK